MEPLTFLIRYWQSGFVVVNSGRFGCLTKPLP